MPCLYQMGIRWRRSRILRGEQTMLRSSVGSCNNLLGAIFRVCFVNLGRKWGLNGEGKCREVRGSKVEREVET